MNKIIYILTLSILISSCKSNLENESVFPEVKNVTELKNTDFVPTLESSFEIKNNVIYAATIPFAWNEIRSKIRTVLTDFSNTQLEEINNTQSHINVLQKNEYETSVEVIATEIRAKFSSRSKGHFLFAMALDFYKLTKK